ncbi:potassium-transporting ATPase subunit C [Pseudofrankia sp. DC12]|uniref:potassium-transporting ATPase subunit C n=1 Tax=Pseudofrankia sp. DC12 TaxID=683315 RepID=UPI0005F7EFD8|nr:potassium-transporting ATPase subunit C [Pseudofrankia sp. DC12]
MAASRLPSFVRQHLAALRVLTVLTVLTGIAYPLAITGIAQLPGLRDKANGSLVTNTAGQVVGSSKLGQLFTDSDGNPIAKYFQPRPSAAGAGYDPTSTSASNLGPESMVDTLDDPATKDTDESKQSLLTQVCARSKAVGDLEGVNGRRPYCTAGGVGAVLSVFRTAGTTGTITRVVSINEQCPTTPFVATYQGVKVECATFGADYTAGILVPIKGPGKGTDNPVPPDAVTASASGLDPDISPTYAYLQVNRVAKARGLDPTTLHHLVKEHINGRALGFMGEPTVNVLDLNLALDKAAS